MPAHDRNLLQPCSPGSAQSLGAKVDSVPSSTVGGVHDDRLQDPFWRMSSASSSRSASGNSVRGLPESSSSRSIETTSGSPVVLASKKSVWAGDEDAVRSDLAVSMPCGWLASPWFACASCVSSARCLHHRTIGDRCISSRSRSTGLPWRSRGRRVGAPIFRPPSGQRGDEFGTKIHRSGFSFVSEDVLLQVCPP